MGINFRVDRVNSMRVPCGMNSIIHISNNWKQARKAFNSSIPGIDKWDKPNTTYGVVLSVWDDNKRDYVIKCSKGL